ncbi:MAG: hypothetical protein AB8H12_05475 [Lewinella sp.]
MPLRSPHHPNIKHIISDLYSGINPDVIKNNEYLERIQRNCVEQTNPFTCYFTLLLGENPKITWRHNTGRHFGMVNLQYEDVFKLVHPAWLFAYVCYAKAMYEIAHKFSPVMTMDGAAAGSLIPMLHRSGEYFWYHQISVRVASDGDLVAAHLNYYHQSSTYTSQLPNMPQLTTSGEPNKMLTVELAKLATEFLPDFLLQFLSETQVAFMLHYREIIHIRSDDKITQGDLLELIDGVDTIDNLNKIKHRIKKSTMAHFKHPALSSAHGLGVWLNKYFPIPKKA